MKEFTDEEIEKIKENANWEIENFGRCSKKSCLDLLKTITQLETNLDYAGYYQAYLLGMTTKEEFEEISKKFVVEAT